MFVQRVVPETSKLFVRMCSSGQRCADIKVMCVAPHVSWNCWVSITSSHGSLHHSSQWAPIRFRAPADNVCLIALLGVTFPAFWSLTPPLPSSCRVCEINSVDNSVISTFAVHEFEGANRLGSRSRRYIITGHSNGNVQVRTHTHTLTHPLTVEGGGTAVGAIVHTCPEEGCGFLLE